jgi:hypothetical protein
VANILSYLQFVKDQAAFHERQAAKMASMGNQKRQAKHQATSAKFNELAVAIEMAQRQLEAVLPAGPSAMPAPESGALTLRPEDLTGLPPELLRQLKITEGDKLEAAIVEVINEAGGTILLDKLLIGLFRKTGDVHQRSTLVGRLYRMSQKDLVWSVPRKKGVYTTNSALGVPAEEAAEDTP